MSQEDIVIVSAVLGEKNSAYMIKYDKLKHSREHTTSSNIRDNTRQSQTYMITYNNLKHTQ